MMFVLFPMIDAKLDRQQAPLPGRLARICSATGYKRVGRGRCADEEGAVGMCLWPGP